MAAGRQRFRSRSLMFDNISYEMISFSNSGGRVLTKSHKYDISYEDLSLFGVPPPRVDLPLQVRLHIPANLPTDNTSFHLPKMSAVAHSGILPNISLHHWVDCIYSSDCGMQIVVEDSAIPTKLGVAILHLSMLVTPYFCYSSFSMGISVHGISVSDGAAQLILFFSCHTGNQKALDRSGSASPDEHLITMWSGYANHDIASTRRPNLQIYKVDGSNRIQLAHTESGKLM